MKGKIRRDREAFNCNTNIFAYIYARLEGTAQTIASPYYAQGGADGMESSDHFAIFLLKFEKELAEGGGGYWADAVRINYLKGALNSTLWDYLISVINPLKTYPEYT
ncbi:hypothetical protein K456DRAFT_58856 [Colletotrichum gloeosporioides 23]|nr:hypothetical protein K456DRAFT_58856 [Colletotrichum gloeosporioides 23]